MEKPKFNNKPNAHVMYYYSDARGVKINQDFFISRAIAVVGIVFAFTNDGMQILIIKRSDKMRDEPGKHGLPCGYLDWGETRHEAMIREVYEEANLYLPDYEKYLMFNNKTEPIYTNDDPKKDKHQNVSHIYLSVYDFHQEMDKFPIGIETFTCKETAEVHWMRLDTFYLTYPNYQWAFNHDETIKYAVNFHNTYFFYTNTK